MLGSPARSVKRIMLDLTLGCPDSEHLVCHPPGQAARGVMQDGLETHRSRGHIPHVNQAMLGKRSKRTAGGTPGRTAQRRWIAPGDGMRLPSGEDLEGRASNHEEALSILIGSIGNLRDRVRKTGAGNYFTRCEMQQGERTSLAAQQQTSSLARPGQGCQVVPRNLFFKHTGASARLPDRDRAAGCDCRETGAVRR